MSNRVTELTVSLLFSFFLAFLAVQFSLIPGDLYLFDRRSTLTPAPLRTLTPAPLRTLTPAPLPSGEGRLEIPFPRLRGKGMGWGMGEGRLELPFSLGRRGRDEVWAFIGGSKGCKRWTEGNPIRSSLVAPLCCHPRLSAFICGSDLRLNPLEGSRP